LADKEVIPMIDTQSDAETLELIGERLCLNFANTVGNHRGHEPHEHMRTYAALVAWSRHVGILPDSTTDYLLQEASHREDEALRVFDRAVALREAIYRIFSAVAEGVAIKPADLSILNHVLAKAMARARIVRSGDGFYWDWSDKDETLDRMLWPIARSAAELLTSEDLARVRECSSDTCGWLFVDASKNHSRRWCSMSDCGNRAKARRHYARLKKIG
jgi:predicted RNA-binding Zn ribbon-like protein